MKFLRTKYGSRLLAVLLLLTGGLRSLSAAELLHSRFSLVLPDLFPTNDVRDLFQDSDGYIWMGTDCGLLRYDGYDLVTYDQSLAPGIGFNAFVNTVAEDRDKTIWIGTEHGLFALDKTTGIISAAECGELADDNVSVVFCDTGNGVWAAGEKGLFRKGPTLRKFFPVDLRDNDGIPVSGITSVIKDHNVCLWIVARSCGLLRYDIREKRAYLYDDPLLREAAWSSATRRVQSGSAPPAPDCCGSEIPTTPANWSMSATAIPQRRDPCSTIRFRTSPRIPHAAFSGSAPTAE